MLLLVNVSVNNNVVNGSIRPGPARPKAAEGEMLYERVGDLRRNNRAIDLMTLGWAALKPLPEEMAGRRQDRIEDLLALHAQHFPQLRQTLATLDADYVRRKSSGEMEWHLREERRCIVERFLSGLAEDFGGWSA
jgi:hypothetical protein